MDLLTYKTFQHTSGHFAQGCEECSLCRSGIFCCGFKDLSQIFANHAFNIRCPDIHAEGRGNGVGVNTDHILKIQFRFLFLVKAAAGKYIQIWVFQLLLHDLGLGGHFNDTSGQIRCIRDTGRERGCTHTFSGADDAHDLQRFARFDHLLHMVAVFGHILPQRIFFVVFVQGKYIHQPQVDTQQVIIGPLFCVRNLVHNLAAHDVIKNHVQCGLLLQAQSVGHHIRDLIWIREDYDHLTVVLRPFALKHLVLGIQKFPVIDHLIENICSHQTGHHGIAHDFLEQCAGVGLQNAVGGIFHVNSGLDAVAILDRADGMIDFVIMFFQIRFEGCQIVGADLGKHLGNHLLLYDYTLISLTCLRHGGAQGREHGAHVRGFRLDA